MTALNVFFTERAPVARAQWYKNLLEPVCRAARLTPYPLEVRQTGRWGGWCSNSDAAPDGRVIVSSEVVFWTAESILSVYLHELCHRLLDGRDQQSHGPVFVALNALVLTRCSAFFRSDPIEKLSFYDLQDCPPELEQDPNWRGLVVNFVVETVAQFADSDVDAIELPKMVEEAWAAWLKKREVDAAAHAALAKQAAKAKSLAAQIAVLRQQRFIFDCVFYPSIAIFLVALLWMFFKVIFR